MSPAETNYLVRLINGTEALTDPDGSLSIHALMYLQAIAAAEEDSQELRRIVGEKFDTLLAERLRTIVPMVLDMLRSKPVVHAIANYTYFLGITCPECGIMVSEFADLEEIRKIWIDAHTRSALEAVKHLGEQNPEQWQAIIASATVAGIPPLSYGVPQAQADAYIDRFFGRNDPILERSWKLHQKNYAELRQMLSV